MADDAGGNQEEKRETGPDLVPQREAVATESWELVLARADRGNDSLVPGSPTPPPSQPRALIWLKAGTPLLVLLIFLGYKFAGSLGGDGMTRRPEVPTGAASLTGVRATADEPLGLSREARVLVGELEALRGREAWRPLRSRIAAETRPELLEHPVVRAFDLIAAVRAGEQGGPLERAILDVSAALRPAGREYRDLIQELDIARANLVVLRSTSPEMLAQNIDLLHQLLGPGAETAYEVKVRLRLASAHEEIGDRLHHEADGYLRKDRVKAAEARLQYQSALRWIVDPAAWMNLRAISPSAESHIARLEGKLRASNSLYHGYALPLTGRDSTTWNGLTGTPTHDHPTAGRTR